MGFSNLQIILAIVSSLLILLSLILQFNKRFTGALIFLLLGAFSLFLSASLLDSFLNLWDERFHALVAKNLMSHPLMPTLYDNPVVSMAYDRWDRSVIWLHKQPLFLWQIAFSFKLFGINEMALRFPSVCMSTGLVFFAYRIGRLAINQRTGYVAALLTATSYHLAELVSGRIEVDHNDVAFLFYVTASIWAWIEYLSSGKRYWIFLIGFFSGSAILCKWLVGLLVYAGWGLYNILVYRLALRKYLSLLVSLLITLAVAIPWQILIYSWYPAETEHTMLYNILHFTRVLEGHGGSFWYYAETFGELFGKGVLYLIIPSIGAFIYRIENKPLGISLLSLPLLVYLFFSLAATKMPSYPFVAAIPVFLFCAAGIDAGLTSLARSSVPTFISLPIKVLLFIVLVNVNLQPARINETHCIDSQLNTYSLIQLQNKEIFRDLGMTQPPHTVVFNVKGRHYVECMFYSGFPAYPFIPAEEQVNFLLTKGHHVAVFLKEGEQLPLYLTSSAEVTIIPTFLNGWD